MSRVLRRPMFRKGGSVSEGTGITSGLMDNYENGGTVGNPTFAERFRNAMEQTNANEKARWDYLKSDKSYNLNLNDIYNPLNSSDSILQTIYDVINPSTETIVKRLQERQRMQGEPIIKTQSYREEQKRINKIMEDREKEKLKEEEQKRMLASEKEKLLQSNLDKTITSEQPAKSDLKTVYEDLLPLFKKELGAAEDEFSRQKYLELAKFGLNLLRQPAGPIGGKANIFGAAAAAAEKPLEAYGAILAKEKQAERLPKALALEAAMKEAEPGSIGRAVKDLQKLGISKEEAIRTATQSGTATREQTYESVVKNIQESLVKDGVVTNANAARGTAEDLLIAEKKYGIRAYQFEPFPKDKNPIEGNYYIMKNGQSGRYYKGSLIKPGEQGFVGELTK